MLGICVFASPTMKTADYDVRVGVDETLARAQQVLEELERKKAENEHAFYAAWAEDAQQAWDEGRPYHQPVIEAHSIGSNKETPRGLKAEAALQAIAAVGWQLHTWAVVDHSSRLGRFVFAHPLFIRGSS